MKKQINPRVLITQWPPPTTVTKNGYNYKRIATWLKTQIAIYNLRPKDFTSSTNRYHVSTRCFYDVLQCQRRLSTAVLCRLCKIIANKSGQSFRSLKKQAVQNTRPWEKISHHSTPQKQ